MSERGRDELRRKKATRYDARLMGWVFRAVLAILVAGVPACEGRLAGPEAASRPANDEIILATTTSTQDSGLLDVLVPMFEQRTGYRVKPIAVGTGQALMLGARGEADVVLAHAPAAEREWMAEGNGSRRVLVMHNEFLIVGPGGDPAGARRSPSAEEAFRTIADAQTLFISRGDGSGTHQKEREPWAAAGVEPRGRPWYQEAGQGMGATLSIASEKGAYTLSDRATYLTRKGTTELDVIVEKAAGLRNIYHVMPVSGRKFSLANLRGAEAFADFLVSAEAQAAIRTFGLDRFGQPLFFPDAGMREEDLDSLATVR